MGMSKSFKKYRPLLIFVSVAFLILLVIGITTGKQPTATHDNPPTHLLDASDLQKLARDVNAARGVGGGA